MTFFKRSIAAALMVGGSFALGYLFDRTFDDDEPEPCVCVEDSHVGEGVTEEVVFQGDPLDDILDAGMGDAAPIVDHRPEPESDRAKRYHHIQVAGHKVFCMRPEFSRHKARQFEPLPALEEQENRYGETGRQAFRDGLNYAGANLHRTFRDVHETCWSDLDTPDIAPGIPSYESVAALTYCPFFDTVVEKLVSGQSWFVEDEIPMKTGQGPWYEKAFREGERAAGEIVKRAFLEAEQQMLVCTSGTSSDDIRMLAGRVYRLHPEIFREMESE